MWKSATLAALLLFVSLESALAQGRTPVLVSSDEECQLSVDGEAAGSVSAGGVKKLELAPGEHLVSAQCGSRRWKDTVSVGSQQKIVTIPGAGGATPAAATPSAKGYTGAQLERDATGRWMVHAVVKGGPADRAGVQPGSIVISGGGIKMKDATEQDLAKIDAGAPGSTLEAEILDRSGDLRKVVITRGPIAESGRLDVLDADGKTIRQATYDRDHPLGSAPAAPAFSPALAELFATSRPFVAAQSWNVMWDVIGDTFNSACRGTLSLSATGLDFRTTYHAKNPLTCSYQSFTFAAEDMKEVRSNALYGAALQAFHIKLRSGLNYNLVALDFFGSPSAPYLVVGALQPLVR